MTFHRPTDLRRCVESVLANAVPSPDGRWHLDEIVVIDNDPQASASEVVDEIGAGTAQPVRYVCEPTPGVGAARNRALDEANGRILVFIDDDELATPGWPEGLVDTMVDSGAALVGGPVVTRFEGEPPPWVTEGGFFVRPDPADRSTQQWLRSGNLAIDTTAVAAAGLRFNPSYRQGEDVEFTRRAGRAGLDLRWSKQGTVIERVGGDRLTKQWRIERERSAMAAWTRCELDLDGSASTVATVAAKSFAQITLGSAQWLAGTVTSSEVSTMAGRVRLAKGRGRVLALGKLLQRAMTSRPVPSPLR